MSQGLGEDISNIPMRRNPKQSKRTIVNMRTNKMITSINVPGVLMEVNSSGQRDCAGVCHIHKIVLSATLDPCSHIHQLWSTFTQLAVRTLQTSFYILLHYVPCTFDPSVLDSLLGFHHSCVQL